MSIWPRDDERGVTVVLVAFLIVGLFGLLAVALDISRLMFVRNQMQIAADAGALAGALTVIQGDTLGARDSARAYAMVNQADTSAMLEDTAVVFGSWDPDDGTFVVRTDPTVSNAIRVRSSREITNLVAWIVGEELTTARASAIGVFQSNVTETTCMRPFAVARENIDTNEDGVITEEERNLAYGREIIIKPAESASDAPSFYYAVVLPPFYDASKNETVALSDSAKSADALQYNLETCNVDLVGVGDSLLTKPGANFGPMKNGLGTLCGEVDPVTGACNFSGAFSDDGLPGIPILAPLWDSRVAPIGRSAVAVTDVAAFRITHVVAKAGKVEIRGFFMRSTDGGAATTGLGLVERPLLVR